MAWSSSNRKSQLPDNWETAIRPAILKRDNYRCQWVRADTGRKCGASANQVDHKDQSRHNDHSPANLQSLCSWHHSAKSSQEGGRAAAAARERRKAATKRHHPGLLP